MWYQLSDTSLSWPVGYLLIAVKQNPPAHFLKFSCKFIAGTWPWDMWVQARHSFSAARPLTSCSVLTTDSPVGSKGTTAASSHPQAYTLCSKLADECLLPVMSVDWNFPNNSSNSPRLVFYHSRITLASHISAEAFDIQKSTSGWRAGMIEA